jgi:hypothetical protein
VTTFMRRSATTNDPDSNHIRISTRRGGKRVWYTLSVISVMTQRKKTSRDSNMVHNRLVIQMMTRKRSVNMWHGGFKDATAHKMQHSSALKIQKSIPLRYGDIRVSCKQRLNERKRKVKDVEADPSREWRVRECREATGKTRLLVVKLSGPIVLFGCT